MICKNLKVSFERNNAPIPLNLKNIVYYVKNKNYIIKFNHITITLYNLKTKNINATNLKGKKDVFLCKKYLEENFHFKIIKIRIDNSLFSGKLYKQINLQDIMNKIRCEKNWSTNISLDSFPGLFIKPRNEFKGYPTIILFSNGSYVFIGGTQQKLLKESFYLLLNITS